MGYLEDEEGISLKSIDLADQDSFIHRTPSSSTDDGDDVDVEGDYADDEEMSHGLTTHAQKISGTVARRPSNMTNSVFTTPKKDDSRFSALRMPSRRLPSTPTRRSASPMRKRVSLAVKEISSRVVSLASDNDPPAASRKEQRRAQDGSVPEKDTFSTKNALAPSSTLQGKTLRFFGSENKLRQRLCDILLSNATQPLLLLLIVFHAIVLTIDASYDAYKQVAIVPWTRWALLGIFAIYTLEMFAHIIVSGLWTNPKEFSSRTTSNRPTSVQPSALNTSTSTQPAGSKYRIIISRTLTSSFGLDVQKRTQDSILRKAYLRHSFNRIDFVSIICFWIDFVLVLTKLDIKHHTYIFKAISCIRILRLLNVTRGTSTILRSLKKAAPLLVNVAFFVGFFWVFFAVIGVQSFKGSFRRQCVWVDPAGIQANQTQYLQFCGGQYVNGLKTPFLLQNWQDSGKGPKGYICPEQSWCVQDVNPYGDSVSFDNFFNSMELVFVIMSSNTFTDLMYYTMDSDYYYSAFFFIAGTLVLTFWSMSLVIAVITTSFQVIRSENQSSAFAASKTKQVAVVRRLVPKSKTSQIWFHTRYFWVILVAADLATQAFKRASLKPAELAKFELAETIFTSAFAFEITCRWVCELPGWRNFCTPQNFFDLFLAMITCTIQIPLIKHSGSLYRWLTVFQIMRSYRIIQAIPFTRDLIGRILRNASGLINLIFFVFVSVYIAALIGYQLLHGIVPQEVYGETQEMTFKNIFNSFVAMYQILSSENWTSILYASQSSQYLDFQSWIPALFLIVWFVFGQNIVMSMFIAVLQESFEVSEEDKRREQVRVFVQKTMPLVPDDNNTTLTMFTLFKRRRPEPIRAVHRVTQFGSMLGEHNVRDFLADQPSTPKHTRAATIQESIQSPWNWFHKVVVQRLHAIIGHDHTNPFDESFSRPSPAALSAMAPHAMAAEVAEALDYRKTQQEQYLRDHPSYDKVFWLLGPESRIRRICQRIVAPNSGERLHSGQNPVPAIWYIFSALMYFSTAALVVIACITTPIYQKTFHLQNPDNNFPWFSQYDAAFTLIFSAEFLIKVFADGFCATPNAYLRNTWNRIDLFVLFSLWVNSIADLLERGSVSRAFGAFKALRALRLVNISDSTKAIFYDVLIAGFWNIAGAAIVSLVLLVPMAVWGLNMFSGYLYSCNDDNVANISECYYEYSGSPNSWDIWVPRSWENPQVWSFDSFVHSLLILFEIVSQEGWIDVMTSAMAITGSGTQPEQDASSVNAIFFIMFNLLGAVFVLTLFIAVIIQNYSERSGIAFLTTEQRSWQEMRLLLKQVRPSRRPADAPKSPIRRWCFFAVKKQSTWNRCLIAVYCAHVLLLITEHFPEQKAYNFTRNLLFLSFSLFYAINVFVRIIGLGWTLFLRSKWNIYNMVVVFISLGMSSVVFVAEGNVLTVFLTSDKVFLVLVAMNLIQVINPLDQLFKTTAGAIPALASLMATWLVLFITFAIAFNQIFGLTKIGENGTDNLNFRTVPKALIVLFRMSVGEGWNSIMHDYAISEPYCTSSSNFYESDCGSESWAYFLFIAWNIVSMYIFVNIVISLVYSNFSYVYQRSGKMSSISRAEIRRFKSTWAKFDDGSGHIPKEQIGRFLSSLDGAFEVRIYPAEYSVPSIIANCRKPQDTGVPTVKELNLEALDLMTSMMDVSSIHERRLKYNRLYTELMQDPNDRGVSFTTMLLSISHNKFVDENKSLGLREFLYRRNVRQDVDRTIAQEVLINFFDSLAARRQRLEMRSQEVAAAKKKPPTKSLTLEIPRVNQRAHSLDRSATPSPTSTNRMSWRLGRDASTGSYSRSPGHSPAGHSPAPSTRTPMLDVDYEDLLAGTAWSGALDGTTRHSTHDHQ